MRDVDLSALVAAQRTFVVTEGLAHLLTALTLILLIVLFHVLVGAKAPSAEEVGDHVGLKRMDRRRGLKCLLVGSDGRASTSKVQFVMWTAAVLYALLFLLLWGRSFGCSDPTPQNQATCAAAEHARSSFDGLIDRGLQTEYYILLGFPGAAALAAKALQVNRAPEKRSEPIAENHDDGFLTGLAEVVSTDDGETDLMDLQYFAFNLLTLGFFLFEFLPDPSAGLPDIPPTLLALTGLATASYTTKKGLEAAATAEDDGGGDAPEGTDDIETEEDTVAAIEAAVAEIEDADSSAASENEENGGHP